MTQSAALVLRSWLGGEPPFERIAVTPSVTQPSRSASAVSSFVDRLASTGQRLRLYGVVAFALLLMAIGARVVDTYQHHVEFDFLTQDGRGYYVYLPALLIEGNLRIEKQMTEHWGRESNMVPLLLSHRSPRGYVVDPYPVGMALTLSPAFLLAHGITLLVHPLTPSPLFTPDGYTVLYQLLDAVWVLAIGWGMMALTDRLIVRHFHVPPATIAGGILLYWVGSNYIWYYLREMFMVHIVSAFWVVASVTLILRIVAKAQAREQYGRDMAILGFVFGMAFICRPTNAFIAPFFVWAIIRIHQAGGLAQFARTAPAALAFFIPAGIQMAIWHRISGSLIFYSYGHERFYFLHPALWQTLFHIKHGVFIWTPLYVLSVIGIVWWTRRPNHQIEPALGCFILSGLLLWYVNSSWWCWWFADSFGARAWIELAPLFIMGLVFALNALRTASKAVRTTGIAFIVVCLVLNWVLLGLYQLRLIPRG